MMPIAHSSRYTTVLNPPNLAGFGAAADTCEGSPRMSCDRAPPIRS